MTSILLFIIIFFILLVAVKIFLYFKNCNHKDLSFGKIENLIDKKNLNDEKEIAFLLEIKKIQIDSIPWFMRAISSIGVVAFFSMMLATLIQTIDLTSKKNELENIKQKQVSMIKEQKEFESTIDVLILNIEEQLIKYKIKLTKEHIKLIKYKIKKLEKSTTPNYYELYRLSIIIGDKEKAFNAITKSDRKSQNIPDIISLIEYQCYMGNKIQANKLLKQYKLDKKISKLSSKWALKVYVLMSYIDENEKKYLQNIKILLNKNNIKEASKWLDREIKRLEIRDTYKIKK